MFESIIMFLLSKLNATIVIHTRIYLNVTFQVAAKKHHNHTTCERSERYAQN